MHRCFFFGRCQGVCHIPLDIKPFTLQPRHVFPHASAWHIVSAASPTLRPTARAAAAQPNVETFRLGGHGAQDLTGSTIGQNWCGLSFNKKQGPTVDG